MKLFEKLTTSLFLGHERADMRWTFTILAATLIAENFYFLIYSSRINKKCHS